MWVYTVDTLEDAESQYAKGADGIFIDAMDAERVVGKLSQSLIEAAASTWLCRHLGKDLWNVIRVNAGK